MTGIKPRTTTVIIYQGDDIDRLAVLDEAVERTEVAMRLSERAAKNAQSGGVRTIADDIPEATRFIEASAEYQAAIEARDLFAAEAEERGVKVALHALPRKDWFALREDHPPRPDNADDARFGGINSSTLPDVLLPKSIDREASTIVGDLGEFLDSLSAHDFEERLFMTAVVLNKGQAVADPTLRLGSLLSQTSSAT